MAVPSKMADRLVERIFGSRRQFGSQELEKQQPAKPPRSVTAQLEDGRKQREASRIVMRGLRRLF